MKFISKILIAFLFFAVVIAATSCRSKRGPKEYIEKNGLHDGRKPHELAKEFGVEGKKQKKAYRKQLRRAARDIKRRNKKKVKGEYYDKK